MPLISADPDFDDDDNDSFFEVTAADQFIEKPKITSSFSQQLSSFDDQHGVSGGGPPTLINAPHCNEAKRFSSNTTTLSNTVPQHLSYDTRTTVSMTDTSSCEMGLNPDHNRSSSARSNSNPLQPQDTDDVSVQSMNQRRDMIASHEKNDEYIMLRAKNREYEESIIRLTLELAETRAENERHAHFAQKMTQQNESLNVELEEVKHERNILLGMHVHERVEIQEMEDMMRSSYACTSSKESVKDSLRGKRFSTTQFGDQTSHRKLKVDEIVSSTDATTPLEIPFPERFVSETNEVESQNLGADMDRMLCTSDTNQNDCYEQNTGNFKLDEKYEDNVQINQKQEHKRNATKDSRENSSRFRLLAPFHRLRLRGQNLPHNNVEMKATQEEHEIVTKT